MNPSISLYVDGEKVPDSELDTIFRSPPDVPETFHRSTLIIGARGSGKTVLLRYHKERHHGLALYMALSTQLAPISRIGLGALTYNIPEEMKAVVPGMSTALLALSILDRVLKKVGSANSEVHERLNDCLPIRMRAIPALQDEAWIESLKIEISRATRLDEFAEIESRSLASFVASVGETMLDLGRPLLLLFDKAEQVTPASLVPVFELLDQSSHFNLLVAIRPGYTAQVIDDLVKQIVPGDHYDVVHLGSHPRSDAWIQFVEAAIVAQLEVKGVNSRLFYEIDPNLRRWIILLTRDSLRTALELFARFLSTSRDRRAELLEAAEGEKDMLLGSAQSSIVPFLDFKEMSRRIREQAISQERPAQLPIPVCLRVEPKAADDLFQASTTLNRFIEGGLRCGAFCMPDGSSWVPGVHPLHFEIAPILLWRRSDEFYFHERSEPVLVSQREAELRKSFSGPPKPPTIFVAFRMNNAESIAFRKDFEQRLAKHPKLRVLEVRDGHLPAGTPDWAGRIRKLIADAKAVVGDITNVRSEVMFEMGLAFGLGKISIPVIDRKERLQTLPPWLTAPQLGSFGEAAGIRFIVSGLEQHLADTVRPRPIAPVPSLVTWLCETSWTSQVRELARHTLEMSGIPMQELVQADFAIEDARRAAQSALLIATLDGTQHDSFVHFVCGALVAKPEIGRSPKTLKRRIILLVEQSSDSKALIASSLGRCNSLLEVIPSNNRSRIQKAVSAFCSDYQRWAG